MGGAEVRGNAPRHASSYCDVRGSARHKLTLRLQISCHLNWSVVGTDTTSAASEPSAVSNWAGTGPRRTSVASLCWGGADRTLAFRTPTHTWPSGQGHRLATPVKVLLLCGPGVRASCRHRRHRRRYPRRRCRCRRRRPAPGATGWPDRDRVLPPVIADCHRSSETVTSARRCPLTCHASVTPSSNLVTSRYTWIGQYASGV